MIASCNCGLVTDTIYRCSPCHRYWIYGTERASVSSVLKDVLPPSYDGVDEAVLDNARDRGNQVDALVSEYIAGRLTDYPVGTRHDSKAMFEVFLSWFWKQGFKQAAAQVITHDSEIAGTMDLDADDDVYDLKCVSRLLPSHYIQVAAYRDLRPAKRGFLIHLRKDSKKPKVVEVNGTASDDWRAVRHVWNLKRRISA